MKIKKNQRKKNNLEVKKMKPVLIVIAGGSASGKTTVVDKIQKRLNSIDVTVIRLSLIHI